MSWSVCSVLGGGLGLEKLIAAGQLTANQAKFRLAKGARPWTATNVSFSAAAQFPSLISNGSSFTIHLSVIDLSFP